MAAQGMQACQSIGKLANLGIKVENGEDGSVYGDSCDVFISGQGALNNWKWPDIPGLHDFKGKLLHSANWDESYDYRVSDSFSR